MQAGDWLELECEATYDSKLAITWTWTFNGREIKRFGEEGFDVSGAKIEVRLAKARR